MKAIALAPQYSVGYELCRSYPVTCGTALNSDEAATREVRPLLAIPEHSEEHRRKVAMLYREIPKARSTRLNLNPARRGYAPFLNCVSTMADQVSNASVPAFMASDTASCT